MRPGFMAPKGALDNKPPHGTPCNNCGLCCQAVLCPLGMKVFKQVRGPCPALVMTDKVSSCGLVEQPMRFAMKLTLQHGIEAMRKAALILIGAGYGCDARFNGEKPDEVFYTKLRQVDTSTRKQTEKSKKLWGFL